MAAKNRKLKNILVTGGAGFIGSNFIRFLFSEESGFSGNVINVDVLTYAGNLESLEDVSERFGTSASEAGSTALANASRAANVVSASGSTSAGGGVPRYFFERADICDRAQIERIFKQYDIDTVVHFAAESHVDRSILGPEEFVSTNVMGTFTLLDVAKNFWQNTGADTSGGNASESATYGGNATASNPSGKMRDDVLFHHISTDEVYGSLGATGYFTETTPYDPRSPYSASKASSDHLAMAYAHTYGLPLTLSNCTNNYGPYQFPEKLLPLMIANIRDGKPLPVYGKGENIRDWIYVEDHNRAVWLIMREGKTGEKYNIGGENEWQNIKLLHKVIELEAAELGKNASDIEKQITFVTDRPGHDLRYAIDCTKIKTELGWQRKVSFEEGLAQTIRWYLSHNEWLENVRSGAYKNWIEKNYAAR